MNKELYYGLLLIPAKSYPIFAQAPVNTDVYTCKFCGHPRAWGASSAHIKTASCKLTQPNGGVWPYAPVEVEEDETEDEDGNGD